MQNKSANKNRFYD